MFTVGEYILLFSGGILAFYYLFFFLRLYLYNPKFTTPADKPVSVIIAAKNEEENLCENLPLILNQNYPEFEVVVVNDCSWDGTQEVLEAFQEKYDHLNVTQLKETELFSGGKKYAVALGVKAARYDYLLFTDADCKPSSKHWITEMMKGFNKNKKIVLGYGKYEKMPGFLNKLIRYDAFSIAQQYLSMALAKIPYMGVGRNMAYHKSLFFQSQGFKKHIHLPSGDDDLFINEVATAEITSVVVNPRSFTVSAPKKTFKEWAWQKKRHLTTAKHYRFTHQIILMILIFSKYSFFSALIFNSVQNPLNTLVLSAFSTWFVMHLTVIKLNMIKLEEKGFWLLSPFLEILLLIIYPIFTVSNFFHKPGRWIR
ncbi:MAG: glycosyltransferase [Bacteroidetes bacterium]|nr:MAG: glycosyltransferase [Bacteroidota bacterium]